MPVIDRDRPMPRAVVFDLDNALLDRRQAWRYALEESISSVCGTRIDVSGLIEEYFARPVSHALAVVVDRPDERLACQRRWEEIYYRSGLKRLLVHDGVGMGLDRLRGARVEVGAVSREPHAVARRQVESTGLERFVAVLSATPADRGWSPGERLADCLAFLEYAPDDCAFVSGDARDRETAAAAGWRTFSANWVGGAGSQAGPAIVSALETAEALGTAWASVSVERRK